MKKEILKDNNKFGIIALVIIAIICIVTTSYALWSYVFSLSKENSISTATLILQLDDSSVDGISLLNSVPVSDEKGKTYEPYTFTLKNTGTITAKYKLYLEDDNDKYTEDGCTSNKLAWSNIKYSLTSSNENSGLLSNTSGLIDEGTIDASNEKEYSLRLWIDKDATNEIMGQHFHGKLKVEAIQNE